MTPQTPQQMRSGMLVLNRLQAGLALGLVCIACIVAFGGGFIVGMWYQASEQITPYDATRAEPPPPQEPAQPLTFYSTLSESADELGPIESPGRSPEPPPPAAAPAETDQPEASGSEPRQPESAGVRDAASDAEPPAARPPESAAVPALQSQPPQPSPSPQPSDTAATDGRYSVQVGSFRDRAQAEDLRARLHTKGYAARVQLTRIPEQGLWYRVRVGNFADRAAAVQAARRLEGQERLSVLIMDEAG